jgi:hypothetical protein
MKQTLTTIVVLLLAAACTVVIVIGISGTEKKNAESEIAQPISSRIVGASTGSAQTADKAVEFVHDGPSQRLNNAATGVVTWLSKPGDVVEFGTVLYAVDQRPVVLMKGSLPMHREIAYKISDGPDVAQFERNLVNFGFVLDEAATGDPTDLTVDQHVTPLTVSAIRAWQLSIGLTSTGIVRHSDVIFRPEPVQISVLNAAVGDSVDGGSVLSVVLNP